MGWEHDRYEAICEGCGHRGVVVESSDDWGRFSRRYEGFENVQPDVNDVGRLRKDSRQSSPVCLCGSRSVVQGARID